MSINKSLSEYTFYSRYSQYNENTQKRESWAEAVNRVFDMHTRRFKSILDNNDEFKKEFEFAYQQVLKKRVLGSQRSLQYGGDPILKRNERLFNCSSCYIDKPKAFQDVVWLLLAGCGVGFSVQYRHINKLPKIKKPSKKTDKTFVIPDTCEGWADSVGVLLSTYFEDGGCFPEYKDCNVIFDFSKIRPKGELIAKKFKAPGSEPLKKGLEKIRNLLDSQFTDKDVTELKPIVAYDLLMHSSDFVISGGLRRSATICLFSKEDEEMMKSKTDNWFIENPQRGRSNNSVVIKRDEIGKSEFNEIFKNIEQYGEPGFLLVDDYNELVNPCVEIKFLNYDEETKETGVGFCNLCEINGKFTDTKEKFLQSCRAATIIGTLQAAYTDFPYLGKTTENIVRRDSLLGVSITGWMDNPEILFNPEILKEGAEECKKVNEKIAKIIGINKASRITCAKPAGHTSCILGTASGIHPHHAKRYIRRVQSNKDEFALKVFKEINPHAVEHSVWSANNTDDVVSFLCEVPAGAITKNQINAIELLEKVKLAQKYWVNNGINDDKNYPKGLTHNISNTITVKPDEWDNVADYIYKNRKYFSGISLLPASGDLDYPQAPFSTILTSTEIVREYGDGAIFASGLVVDGLHAFDNNLWKACDFANGVNKLPDLIEEPEYPKSRQFKELAEFFENKDNYEKVFLQHDWVRRVKQFANRYFKGDVKKTTYCLKHASLLKTWCDLQRDYKDVDWNNTIEFEPQYQEADEQAAASCAGGKCEISF